jgi:hypothetical protein
VSERLAGVFLDRSIGGESREAERTVGLFAPLIVEVEDVGPGEPRVGLRVIWIELDGAIEQNDRLLENVAVLRAASTLVTPASAMRAFSVGLSVTFSALTIFWVTSSWTANMSVKSRS